MTSITKQPEMEVLIERVCAVVEEADWHPRRKASLRALIGALVVRARDIGAESLPSEDCRDAAVEAFQVAAGLAAMADPQLAIGATPEESAERMQHMVVEMINAMISSADRRNAA